MRMFAPKDVQVVKYLADKIHKAVWGYVTREDLAQAGYIALWQMSEKDTCRNYLWIRLQGAMWDEVRRYNSRSGHLLYTSKTDIEDFPEETVNEYHDLLDRIEAQLDALPARERDIIYSKFWLDISGKDLSKKYQVSEGRITQLANQGLNRIKQSIEKEIL